MKWMIKDKVVLKEFELVNSLFLRFLTFNDNFISIPAENYMRPRGSTAFGRRGRDIVSPRSGSISNDSWSGTRNYSNVNHELGRNLSNKGFSIKGDNASNANEALNDAQLHRGRDRESQLSNSWERQKQSSTLESGAKNTQPLVASESFSAAVSEASAAPSSAGITPPAVKIPY